MSTFGSMTMCADPVSAVGMYTWAAASGGTDGAVQTTNSTSVTGAVSAVSPFSSGVDSLGNSYSGSARVYSDLSGVSAIASSSFSGVKGSDGYVASALGISDVLLSVSEPVYLVDSVFADGHGITTTGNAAASALGEFAFFQDGAANPLSSCKLFLNGGQQTCSTGPVLVSAGTKIWTYTYIGAFASSFAGPFGDSGSVSIDYWGTLKPGLLQVYDTNMNLIQTMDLASFTPVPEPSFAGMLAALFAAGLMVKARRFRG